MSRIGPYRIGVLAPVLALAVVLGGGRGSRAGGQEDLPRPATLSGPLPAAAPLAAPPTPPTAGATPLPINLPTALQLASARNLDIVLAARQAQLAAAQLQGSQVLWLPNLILGTDYYRHDGQIQDIVGNVFGTSKQGFMLGGAPSVVFSFSDALFAPLAARQVLRAREAGVQAAANDALLAVTQSYFNVQQARGQLAGSLDALGRTEDLLRRVERLAPGVVPGLEVTRTRTLLTQQREVLLQYENNWRSASAELVRVLHLDPAVVVQPLEPPQLEITLLGPDKPVQELLEVALTHRPELAAQQALVQATLAQLRREKARPLLPSLYVRGFSTPVTGTLATGLFGGGINGAMDNFSWRQDWDVQLLWQLQNFGLGNRALIRQRAADSEAAQAELLRTQDRVAMEVVQAYALAQTAAGRVRRAETEVKQARELVEQELVALGQTRAAGNLIALLVRPQEVVAAIQMLQQAYVAYFTAVADYNRAQFQVYRALGNPAQALLDDPRCGKPIPPGGPDHLPPPPAEVQKPAGTAAAVVQAVGDPAGAAGPGGVQPSYYSEAYAGPAGASRKARIRVRLPTDADLWIGGAKAASGGAVREFDTPQLDPQRVYTYPLRVRWAEGGFAVEKSLDVRATAGTRVTVDFARPPQPPAPPSRTELQPRDWTAAGTAPAR